MSYHIVHILNHASRLSVDRGCLVCNAPDKPERRVPKSDVLALIVAARGVSFSADCLAALMEEQCVILHCDHSYRPIGKTIGLGHVIHSALFEAQIKHQSDFAENLWKRLIRAKTENQSAVLIKAGVGDSFQTTLSVEEIEESAAARKYWHIYFSLFPKPPKLREHQEAKNPVNQMLNYGYAVLSAILHRSIAVHGFNASLGIHHKYRFKSEPLVYDLFEPLRPFVDLLLWEYFQENSKPKMDAWARAVAGGLLSYRVPVSNGKSVKLLYAIDHYVCSAAECFQSGSIDNLYIPALSGAVKTKDE